jgi:tetratricopeptide (TPR) repeat protein
VSLGEPREDGRSPSQGSSLFRSTQGTLADVRRCPGSKPCASRRLSSLFRFPGVTAVHEQRLSATAWLGNANLQAGKFKDAETAFDGCELLLKEHSELVDSAGAADLHWLKGRSRMLRTNYTAAYDLLKPGHEIAKKLGDRKREANLLMTIAANFGYAGSPEEAISSYKRAAALFKAMDQTKSRFFASINLANTLCRSGRPKDAKLVLGETQEPALLTQPIDLYWVKWVEGNVETGLKHYQVAEARYLEAREGFAEVNDLISCACIDLDYAILLAQLDAAKAMEAAAGVCLVLERYRLLPQTLECLALLRRELDKDHAKEIVLRELCAALKRDPLLELKIEKESSSNA